MTDLLTATPPAADILEVVYRMDLAPYAWLAELHAALDDGEDASMTALVRHRDVLALHADPLCAQVFDAICSRSAAGNLVLPHSLPTDTLSGTQSETMKYDEVPPPPYAAPYARLGVSDVWALIGVSPCGSSVFYSRLLKRRARSNPRARRYWDRVAAHLAASARLRMAIEASSEAVLAPDGKLLHAEGRAREVAPREALRRAARTIDRARTSKADPLAAIESWTALVDGRWSLVDQFESDGRHFLIARVNEPDVKGDPQLSARERQVVAFAALGRSNKQIAYELGIEIMSVAGYLRRAARKLNVATRAEIIAHALSSLCDQRGTK